MTFDLAGGHLDRGDAAVGGEVVPGREPAHVPDLAEDERGGCGPDALDVSQGRLGGGDRGLESLVEVLELAVQPGQVFDQVGGELAAGLAGDVSGSDRGDYRLGLLGGQIPLRTGGYKFHQKLVEVVHRLSAG